MGKTYMGDGTLAEVRGEAKRGTPQQRWNQLYGGDAYNRPIDDAGLDKYFGKESMDMPDGITDKYQQRDWRKAEMERQEKSQEALGKWWEGAQTPVKTSVDFLARAGIPSSSGGRQRSAQPAPGSSPLAQAYRSPVNMAQMLRGAAPTGGKSSG